MPRAYITGISGFVGQFLASHLKGKGWIIAGQDIKVEVDADLLLRADLLDQTKLQQAISSTCPDVIFHCAGVLKAETLEKYCSTHVLGTGCLLDACLKNSLSPVVVIASSSAVYGAGLGRRPITEGFMPRPLTHYAVSKLAQEMVALRYHTAYGLPVICVRTFNLLGPGLSPVMACSDFAWQIARAEKSGRPGVVSTGSLQAQRDFVDVRDAVRAYVLLAEKGRAGQVYNVASGRSVKMQECLDFLRQQARVPIEHVVDPARVQKNDVVVQVGSSKRLQDQTGWKTEISVEQSLTDLLDDWRHKVEMES